MHWHSSFQHIDLILPPRVRTPFFEAKDWASTNGPLNARPGVELGDEVVRAVKLTMEKDAQTIADYSRPEYVLGGWKPVVR